jgi:hypothetical protein
VHITVFLKTNPRGLKHVEDVKNWMKVLIWKVHFVGLCSITIFFIWLLFLKLSKWLICFSFIICLRVSVTKLCCNTCSSQAHNISVLSINIICETNILGKKSPFLQLQVTLAWAHAAPYSMHNGGKEANVLNWPVIPIYCWVVRRCIKKFLDFLPQTANRWH